MSTHSYDLLSDKGIGGEEVIELVPGKEGTRLMTTSESPAVRDLLEGGLTIADAVLPRTVPSALMSSGPRMEGAATVT